MDSSPLASLLSEDQALIAQAVGEFARDSVAPRHEALDHASVHPEELWSEIAELGLFAVFVPEELGGAGAGFLAHGVIVETLGEAAGLAGVLPVAQGIVVDALLRSGNDELIGEHLEGLATGEILGSPALQELEPGAVRCVAAGDGPIVTLTGTKAGVPFPGRAGLYAVAARRGDERIVALVTSGGAGVAHQGPEPTLGFAGFETGSLVLDGAVGTVLGGEDLLAEVLTGARISVSALLCGVGQGALNHALQYSGERKQFKVELRRHGALQQRLARSDARVEALRGLYYCAARARDAAAPSAQAAQAARRVRLFAADVIPVVADDAVQVYGGYGYSREYPVERFYRDSLFPGFGEWHAAGTIMRAVTSLDS